MWLNLIMQPSPSAFRFRSLTMCETMWHFSERAFVTLSSFFFPLNR